MSSVRHYEYVYNGDGRSVLIQYKSRNGDEGTNGSSTETETKGADDFLFLNFTSPLLLSFRPSVSQKTVAKARAFSQSRCSIPVLRVQRLLPCKLKSASASILVILRRSVLHLRGCFRFCYHC